MSDEAQSDDLLRFSTGQYLQQTPPKRMAVAVSGGGDSMACLDLMCGHARAQDIHLEAVTLDHGLRAEAADEIALVAAYCAQRDIPHKVLTWSWDGVGNLQAEARNARYRMVAEWAAGRQMDLIVLGHTLDDIAETFLMRLARKAGVEGLAKMADKFERFGASWWRPLLHFGRADLRDYNERHGVPWAEDPSNEDERFDRVKARKALAALAPLGIGAEALSSVAHNLFIANSALEFYVHDTVWRYVEEIAGDLVLPCDVVADGGLIPMEVLFRLRGEALRWIGGGDYAARSDGLIEMDIALHEAEVHTLAGCLITRHEGNSVADRRWRVTREYNAVKTLATSTDQLWDGRWRLDGPHEPDLEIRALGEAVKDTPWRETGMPRSSLMATPAVWRGYALIAAPVAGLSEGWTAEATGRGKFAEFLLSR